MYQFVSSFVSRLVCPWQIMSMLCSTRSESGIMHTPTPASALLKSPGYGAAGLIGPANPGGNLLWSIVPTLLGLLAVCDAGK